MYSFLLYSILNVFNIKNEGQFSIHVTVVVKLVMFVLFVPRLQSTVTLT